MVVLGVYRYYASQFRTEIPKEPKKGLGPSGPPCAQTGVKSSLGTEVFKLYYFQHAVNRPIQLVFIRQLQLFEILSHLWPGTSWFF